MKGDELALDYKAFYNTQALKLIDWMYAEKNTTKRAKLYRTACRIEHRFRRYHGISENRPWKTGSCVHLPVGIWMCNPKNHPPHPHGHRLDN